LTHRLAGKLIGKVFNHRIPLDGLVIDTRSEWISESTNASLFWNLYERRERKAIRRYLARDLDVVELGSSIGVVTCQIRKQIAPACKLISVEANPRLIDTIHTNLAINQCSEKTLVINRAVAYGEEKIHFHVPKVNQSASYVSSRQHANTVEVTTISLSEIISSNQLGEFALVCDIEGAEASILQYDRQALERCRQIIIELHDTWLGDEQLKVAQLVQMLELSYSLVYQRGDVCVFRRKGDSNE
jgi:FkbM family methyltransferase